MEKEDMGLLEHYLHTIYFSTHLFNKNRPILFTQGTIQYHVVSKLLLLTNMEDFTFISVHSDICCLVRVNIVITLMRDLA